MVRPCRKDSLDLVRAGWSLLPKSNKKKEEAGLALERPEAVRCSTCPEARLSALPMHLPAADHALERKSCSKPLVQIADAKLKSFNRSLDYGGPERF